MESKPEMVIMTTQNSNRSESLHDLAVRAQQPHTMVNSTAQNSKVTTARMSISKESRQTQSQIINVVENSSIKKDNYQQLKTFDQNKSTKSNSNLEIRHAMLINDPSLLKIENVSSSARSSNKRVDESKRLKIIQQQIVDTQ
jgi:hypothetical protein